MNLIQKYFVGKYFIAIFQVSFKIWSVDHRYSTSSKSIRFYTTSLHKDKALWIRFLSTNKCQNYTQNNESLVKAVSSFPLKEKAITCLRYILIYLCGYGTLLTSQ